VPLFLEAGNHTQAGEAATVLGRDSRQAETQQARIPTHRRPLRKQRTGEQTSHRCEKDHRVFPWSRWGFGKVCRDAASL